MYSLEDYHYTLPEELIAQAPVASRDQSRLMVLERSRQRISHHRFAGLVDLLHTGDLLVINNTRVIKARLKGTKETGGKIEVLLLDYPQTGTGELADSISDGTAMVCRCLIKASKSPRSGTRLYFAEDLKATVLEGADGIHKLAFKFKGNFHNILEQRGHVPLPPYIKRNGRKARSLEDRQAYQTVYARENGAVAAPTAGLHFTPELLSILGSRGIEIVPITLHVGYGTFLPVRVSDIRDHEIHSETYEITNTAAAAINQAKSFGRRIVAVGTTSVRSLEYSTDSSGHIQAGSGRCDLFIYPGFEFKVVDALITNFHLPQSTLLMLVSAFAGRRFILDAYKEAVEQIYRFFSYGDAMLIH
ncbi:MAG: tRNA preQ1(34) S-adenosylmethionine ribosyltransferase-isomerase QueA [Deltaproteobacteria bacterium]|nr:tRNA preQ1(34) S-adenosylmethionine ribosyltransferase-isomerase QueA [Deltaproteobacteria bacterium]